MRIKNTAEHHVATCGNNPFATKVHQHRLLHVHPIFDLRIVARDGVETFTKVLVELALKRRFHVELRF